MIYPSPLRYPGGKTKFSKTLKDILAHNNLGSSMICEPYAGGAGASLSLLYERYCESVWINDLDPMIYSFWKTVLSDTERLIDKIDGTPVTINEWKKQKAIALNNNQANHFELGFATFFLNRCNRSGILFKAGPIGGIEQTGDYRLDARFNKPELINRILKVASYSDRIKLTNKESITLLSEFTPATHSSVVFFIDPPYYVQGSNLYLNNYDHSDHLRLSKVLKKRSEFNWILTYDNSEEIEKMYQGLSSFKFNISYTLQSKRREREICILSNQLEIPNMAQLNLSKND
jgi:DNA adenine methylase